MVTPNNKNGANGKPRASHPERSEPRKTNSHASKPPKGEGNPHKKDSKKPPKGEGNATGKHSGGAAPWGKKPPRDEGKAVVPECPPKADMPRVPDSSAEVSAAPVDDRVAGDVPKSGNDSVNRGAQAADLIAQSLNDTAQDMLAQADARFEALYTKLDEEVQKLAATDADAAIMMAHILDKAFVDSGSKHQSYHTTCPKPIPPPPDVKTLCIMDNERDFDSWFRDESPMTAHFEFEALPKERVKLYAPRILNYIALTLAVIIMTRGFALVHIPIVGAHLSPFLGIWKLSTLAFGLFAYVPSILVILMFLLNCLVQITILVLVLESGLRLLNYSWTGRLELPPMGFLRMGPLDIYILLFTQIIKACFLIYSTFSWNRIFNSAARQYMRYILDVQDMRRQFSQGLCAQSLTRSMSIRYTSVKTITADKLQPKYHSTPTAVLQIHDRRPTQQSMGQLKVQDMQYATAQKWVALHARVVLISLFGYDLYSTDVDLTVSRERVMVSMELANELLSTRLILSPHEDPKVVMQMMSQFASRCTGLYIPKDNPQLIVSSRDLAFAKWLSLSRRPDFANF